VFKSLLNGDCLAIQPSTATHGLLTLIRSVKLLWHWAAQPFLAPALLENHAKNFRSLLHMQVFRLVLTGSSYIVLGWTARGSKPSPRSVSQYSYRRCGHDYDVYIMTNSCIPSSYGELVIAIIPTAKTSCGRYFVVLHSTKNFPTNCTIMCT
jgi:hypothetical protein